MAPIPTFTVWIIYLAVLCTLQVYPRAQDAPAEDDVNDEGKDKHIKIDDIQLLDPDKQPGYKVLSNNATTTPQPAPVIPTMAGDVPSFAVVEDNRICLRASFQATFTVSYATEGQTAPLKTTIKLPKDAVSSGQCGKDTAQLTLSWNDGNYTLTLYFSMSKNNKTGKLKGPILIWDSSPITFDFDTRDTATFEKPCLKPGIHQVSPEPKQALFKTPSNFSYSCLSKQSSLLHEYDTNNTVDTSIIEAVNVTFWDVHLQAFDLQPDAEFSQAAHCAPDLVDSLPHQNLVPVAVAASLAGLILIIIVAYFILKNKGASPYKAME